MSGQNLWVTLRSKIKDGPMALSIFLIGFMALMLGLIFSWSDYLSSLYGLLSLMDVFTLRIAGGDWVIKAMAMAPQVGQMVFISLYTLDTSRRWALAAAGMWFALDFISDIQYNSGNTFLPQSGGIGTTTTVGVAAGINIMWFSVGAELFLVAGSAIVLTLLTDAIREMYHIWYGIGKAVSDGKSQAKGGKPGNQQSNQPGNQQSNRNQPQGNRNQPQGNRGGNQRGNAMPAGQPVRSPQHVQQEDMSAVLARLLEDDLP